MSATTPPLAAGLFGGPALRRQILRGAPSRVSPSPPPAPDRPSQRSAVSATVTRSFKVDRLGVCFDLDLTLWGAVKLRAVVRGTRFTTAFLRGDAVFEITDPALAAEVHRVAVQAVRDAEAAGGLHA